MGGDAAKAPGARPPAWPHSGWPRIKITAATRLEPDGLTRRFVIGLRLENASRPEALLLVSPFDGARVVVPPDWPDREQWAAEILAAVRRAWPLLLAGAPPAPEPSTLPPFRRPGRPRHTLR